MSLLEDEIRVLEQDLAASPIRISAYHDLPFAIFCYEPKEEFTCRKHIRSLAISLEQNYQKRVTFISLGRLFWEIIEKTEGLDAIVEEEHQFGFERAQETVNTILSDEDFRPLPDVLASRMQGLSPDKDIVFLVRDWRN